MEISGTKRTLEQGAFLLPPMEPFEGYAHDPATAMRMLLLRCESLALAGSRIEPHDSLAEWLLGIMRRNDVAFFGSAMNSPFACKDVDMLFFQNNAPPPHFRKPAFVHIIEFFGCEMLPHAPLFVSGPLLFPSAPDESLIMRIESERRALAERPFFGGGFGELITHSAFKATEAPDSEKDPTLPRIRFKLEWRWFDGTNMRMVTHTPNEINEQVRGQMRALPDEDVRLLAKAAIRRMRVKESRRAELEGRFVSELRAAKKAQNR